MAALQAGDDRAAVDAFTAAYAADGNVAALLNLGIAYTRLGMLTHAVESLTRYTEQADAVRDADTIAQVKLEIERLRTENGVVVVNVTPATGAIQVDGVPVTALAGELIVAPGKRRFEVFADGYMTYDEMLDVQAGRFSLDATLVPVSQAPVALPTPPASTGASEDAEYAAEPGESGEQHCAISNVCFGPVLSLIGPPNLFGGGLHVRLGRYFGAGLDYQMTPSISFDPVSVSSSLFSIGARVYPFGGAFFLGGGFGYQTVSGSFANEDVTVEAAASFPAAMASIGFMGMDGFVMGLDLGVLLPVGSRAVELGRMEVHRDVNGHQIPQSEVDQARDDVQSQVKKVVELLPVSFQLNLLRIGYLF